MPTATDPQRARGLLAAGAEDETGSASIEFLGLACVLLIPLFYLLLFVSEVQAAALGAGAAADQSAKAAVAQEQASAPASVHAVARRTLKDYGVLADQYDVTVDCSPGDCLERQPGMVAQVRVRVEVPLPVVSGLFGVDVAPVAVTSDARQRVPRF